MSVLLKDFKALDVMRFICGECCTTLNTVYRFQQNCLRSKRNLATWVSKLQTFSRVRGTLSVCLRDIRQGINAEDQSAKNQTTLTNIKQEDSQSTVSDHVNNGHIKQEYGSDEDDYIDRDSNHFFFKSDVSNDIKEENVNLDYCNEDNLENLISKVKNEHSGIKQETENEIVDHFSSSDEEYIPENFIDYSSSSDEDFVEKLIDCKKEIDIEEDPLSEVKKVVSDSETPAEGPSQGDRSADAALDTATGSPVVAGGKRHTAKGSYECLKRKKQFKTKTKLTSHITKHSDGKRIKSEICEITYHQKTQLQDQVQKHTGEKPYKCDICKKGLSNHLKRHMRIHTGELPFECDVCKKRYTSSSYLKQHMRTHTGERPYECNVCKKSFNVSAVLTRHMRTHTGDKPYECGVCKRGFSQLDHLKTHMRTHTGERPYTCKVCKKSFSVLVALTQHMRTHTGERPYECDVCKKKFSIAFNLKKHMLTHSGERPHEYDV